MSMNTKHQQRSRTVARKALSLALSLAIGSAASAEVTIGAIFDLTGGLDIYGIQQNNALDLAVKRINSKGGVLGQQIEVVTYDAASDLAQYVEYAKTLVEMPEVSAVFAGLTSSSREEIRPVFRKANMPYFYSSLYEGGACDRQTFVTGSSASQQMEPLISWAIDQYGPDIYVMAPNYNFGTISAHWIKTYADIYGGFVVGEDFLDLSVTDYSETIEKIHAAKPDVVVALPVGSNQTGFLEQFAEAGLNDSISVVSSNYGSGNQQIALSAEAGEGLVASQGYFMQVEGEANAEFVDLWASEYGSETPIVSVAVDVWNAVHIWALAVEKAGSAEPDATIDALQTEISFQAPNGLVTMDGGSHHLRQNIYIAIGDNNQSFEIVDTYQDVIPNFERERCNLIDNPGLVEHFTP